MRKYAIEIYILSLVVLATAILVISDWERVTTLFAGKNDPDHKVAALAYFCGEVTVQRNSLVLFFRLLLHYMGIDVYELGRFLQQGLQPL